MSSKKLLQQTIGLTLVVLLLVGCGGAPALPTPGKWTASAEFGNFMFIVNPKSTGITKITYSFSNWKCGPTKMSGSIGIEKGWPITGAKFTIENTLDPGGNQTMTISGTFDETGMHASGTWKAVSHGVTCSGTWESQ